MIKIKNFTPHPININDVEIQPEVNPIRVTEKIDIIGTINDIPIISKVFGELENCPDYEENTIFIVSLLASQAIKIQRPDISSITYIIGESIRNEKGQIVGCKSFARI